MAKRIVSSGAKVCKACGISQPLSNYHRAPLNKDRLHHECKSCRSAYMARLYEKNKGRIKTRMAGYYVENTEAVIARVTKYYHQNKADCAKRHKDWRQRNWERLRPIHTAYRNSRDAHIKRATPLWADLKKIEAFYRRADTMTAETGIRHSVDHVIPLRGKTVCGLHVENNLQIITLKANKQKHNRFDEVTMNRMTTQCPER